MKDLIQKKFNELFGNDGEFLKSVGRINLIGENIDYNGGYVFLGVIEK